ncbi:hypothetical protein, partial [Enterococcus avium]|uniref:hypothetical protein n=1 Tax=Enterococcus avium TaxID=33945 RepID=UPI001C63667E
SGFLFFLAIVYSPLDLIVEKEKPRSNHLPRINGYLHGLYYTLAKIRTFLLTSILPSFQPTLEGPYRAFYL